MNRLKWTGIATALALHGVLLYGLWHAHVQQPPAGSTPLFVSLLNDAPKPERPAREPRKPAPVKLEKPARLPVPQQRVIHTPAALPDDPVAPAPPPVPPKIESPVESALTPPSLPAGPVALNGELAAACPERTPPSYPSLSRRLGEEGKAVLRVELDESGQIDQATIRTSSGYARLDQAALSAVRQWRCNPAQRDGVAVRAVAIQPFNFVLEGR